MTLDPDRKSTRCRAGCHRGVVIVMASFGIHMIMIGFIKCFGILFVEFVKEFNSSVSMVSVIMGLTSATTSIVSLLVPHGLMSRFSLRTIAMAGAVAASVGVMLTSLATSIYFLLFSVSFFVGCAQGLIYCPGMILIGQYFDRRRALATSIATCGISAGAMLIPLLLRYLIDTYALRGALLILGGITTHMIALAGLYKSPSNGEIITNSSEADTEDIVEPDSLDCTCPDVSIGQCAVNTVNDKTCNNLTNKTYSSLPSIVLNKDDAYFPQSVVDVSYYNTKHVSSDRCLLSRAHAVKVWSMRYGDSWQSLHSITNTGMLRQISPMHVGHADSIYLSTMNLSEFPKDVDISQDSDSRYAFRDLTKNPMFWMMFGFNFFGIVGSGLFPAFLPPLVVEKGLTDVQAALLVSLFSALDFISRLASGLIADVLGVHRRYLLLGSFLVVGVLLQFTYLYSSPERIVMFVVLFGLFNGAYGALHPLVIIDILGSELFASAFGFVQVFHGASLACFFPFLGYLRDVTGSYTTSFCILGWSQLLSALFVALMPRIRRRTNSKNYSNNDITRFK